MRMTLPAAIVVAVLGLAPTARAEFPENGLYIGVAGGGTVRTEKWGLGANAVKDVFEAQDSPLLGLRLGFHLMPQLAVELGAQYLPVPLGGGRDSPAGVYHADVLYHFCGGDLSPFVVGGAGAYHASGGLLGDDFDFQLHLGVGLRGLITDWLAIRLEARDVVTDGFGKEKAISGNNVEFTVGFDFFPVQAFTDKDRDKDGVIDLTDRCPDVPGLAATQGCPDQDGDGLADGDDVCPKEAGKPELKGCPDRDGDGLADKDDHCADQKGLAQFQGCPDQDGDGLADADDACPTEAGKPEFQGCPDRDGDGLADRDDKCPDQKGLAKFQGCPDQDGDGLADADDACPAEAGKPELKGCPDRDADGLADRDDKCPDQRGLKEFDGCLPKEAEKFTGTIKGINFATGKAIILPSSFAVLDEAVTVLKKFPSMRIKIEGHTDTVGDAAKNKVLSNDRAASVVKYLLSKGVEESRLQSEGFGPDRPVADNKTEKGRAQNRRVEFNLIAQ